MVKNPCIKTCPERTSTCHSTCKRYKDFRKAKDEENAQIRKQKELDNSFYNYKRRR